MVRRNSRPSPVRRLLVWLVTIVVLCLPAPASATPGVSPSSPDLAEGLALAVLPTVGVATGPSFMIGYHGAIVDAFGRRAEPVGAGTEQATQFIRVET